MAMPSASFQPLAREIARKAGGPESVSAFDSGHLLPMFSPRRPESTFTISLPILSSALRFRREFLSVHFLSERKWTHRFRSAVLKRGLEPPSSAQFDPLLLFDRACSVRGRLPKVSCGLAIISRTILLGEQHLPCHDAIACLKSVDIEPRGNNRPEVIDTVPDNRLFAGFLEAINQCGNFLSGIKTNN